MAVAFVTCTRNVNGTSYSTFYVGTVLTDNYVYFNDDIKFRCKTDWTGAQMFYYPKQIWVDTNLITDLNGIAFSPTGGNGSVASDANVEAAVQWAINIANDASHGYDQTHRDGPDYDCSSLVWHAFTEGGGFDLGSYAFATGGMPSILTNAGFVQHNFVNVQELQRGDILLRNGHTEIYIGNQQDVGAHSNEFGGITGGRTGDQTGHEISISDFYPNWTWYFRYGG